MTSLRSALETACKERDAARALELAKSAEADEGALALALDYAAYGKDLALMKALVGLGAKPSTSLVCWAASSPYSSSKTTPAECLAVLAYVLGDLGCDPNAGGDDYGGSALRQALEWGDDDILDALVARQARLLPDERGALVPAKAVGRAIDAGVLPNAVLRNAVRAHSLMLSPEDRIAMAESALALGADPNAPDDDGPAPLFVVAAVAVGVHDETYREWAEPILDLTLAHGADVNLVLDRDYDPYQDEDHFDQENRICKEGAAGMTLAAFLKQQSPKRRGKLLLQKLGLAAAPRKSATARKAKTKSATAHEL